MDPINNIEASAGFLRTKGATGHEASQLAALVFSGKLQDWKTGHQRTYYNEFLHLQIGDETSAVRITFVNPSGRTKFSSQFYAADVIFLKNGEVAGQERFSEANANPLLRHLVYLLKAESARIVEQIELFVSAATKGPLPRLDSLRPLTRGEARDAHGEPGIMFNRPRTYFNGYSASVGDLTITATRLFRPIGEHLYIGPDRSYSPAFRPRWEYSLRVQGTSVCPFTSCWRNVHCETDVSGSTSDWRAAKRGFIKMRAAHDSDRGWFSTVRDAFDAMGQFARPQRWAAELVRSASRAFSEQTFDAVVDAHHYLLRRGSASGVVSIPGGEAVTLRALEVGSDAAKLEACKILHHAKTVNAVQLLGDTVGKSHNPVVVRQAIAALPAVEARSVGVFDQELGSVRIATRAVLQAAEDTARTAPDQLGVFLRELHGVRAPVDDSALPYFVLGG